MTHDYKRNGTTSLYATLEIATGEVTRGVLSDAHPQRVPRVPEQAREGLPPPAAARRAGQQLNALRARGQTLAGAPSPSHFHHFTPTSASWMNMVEIWFAILTKQQVRRGVYRDVPELIAAIEHFIEGYNERAQPFVWTKTADQVLAKAIQKQATSETPH